MVVPGGTRQSVLFVNKVLKSHESPTSVLYKSFFQVCAHVLVCDYLLAIQCQNRNSDFPVIMKVQSTPSEEIDGLLSHSATQTGSVVLGNSTISNPPHFLKW